MEDGNQIRVTAGDRFVFLDAGKLTLKRMYASELIPVNGFYGAQRAELRVPRKPDFAIRAPADNAGQFVIGDRYRRS